MADDSSSESSGEVGVPAVVDLRDPLQYNQEIEYSNSDDQLEQIFVAEERSGVVWQPAGGEKVAESEDYESLIHLARDTGEPLMASSVSAQYAVRGIQTVLESARAHSGSGALRRLDVRGALKALGKERGLVSYVVDEGVEPS